MLIVMDYRSQPSLKSLKMHFHTIVKLMDATGCLVVRKNMMLCLGKGQP